MTQHSSIKRAAPLRTRLLLAAMGAGGLALSVRIFFPGVMTYDAMYVYRAISEGRVGDWQSPVMTAVWALIDPLAPGSASMFLLIAGLYWLGFTVLALTIAGRCPGAAIALMLVALVSPAFALLGSIWRDVLFANVWLLACALAFASRQSERRIRIVLQPAALALLILGLLLRPNALFATPLLAAYILAPDRIYWKRLALLYVPAIIGLYGLVQVVYYGVFDAMRQNPLHSVMVFDLGGITHFSKQNQFPVNWTANEAQLLTERCYNSSLWDVYWTRQPCSFVMARLERDKIFGSDALAAAWKDAVLTHPLSYLQHRLSFMRTFLVGDNLTMWTQQLDDPTLPVFADKPAFNAFKALHEQLKPTPLFRTGAWLLLCLVALLLNWRRREQPAAPFIVAICASAIVYTLTFSVFGVASDFRYALWAVIAGSAGMVLTFCRELPARTG